MKTSWMACLTCYVKVELDTPDIMLGCFYIAVILSDRFEFFSCDALFCITEIN